MADDDKLAIYAELHRRGQVPEEYKPVVSELVKRGVIKGEPGIDRTFGGDEDTQKKYEFAKRTQSPFQRRLFDSAMMGGGDEVLAGLGALVETPFSKKTLGQNYDLNLQYQRALRDDAREQANGGTGLAADLMGGLMMAPGKAVAGATAAAPIGVETWRQGLTRLGKEKLAMAPQLAKTGAVYGAGNAFLGTDGGGDGSTGDGFVNRLAAMPSGAVEGAIGALTIGNALHTGLGVRDIRAGQQSARKNQQMLNRLAWEAENMTAPGYAISESPSVRATAPSMADSIIGGSIRNDAAARTAQLEQRVRDITNEHTGGAGSSDLGEAAQTSLRRNLREYSTPNREISNASNAELERISGPVTAEGFRPPRPTVEPVQPRSVAEVTPEQFQRDNLPGRVQPAEPQFTPPDFRNIPPPPEVGFDMASHQARVKNFNRKYEPGGEYKQSPEVATRPPTTRRELELNAVARKLEDLSSKYGPNDVIPMEVRGRMQRLVDRHDRLTEELRPMREEHAALLAERKALAARSEEHRTAEFVRQSKEAHALAAERARQETLQQNARAETEYRREQARQEADRATQSARDAAERSYNEELANNPHGFRAGRSRESYPTEFAAGYERVARETPPVNRNPLGARNSPKTATESLINDFALDGFKGGSIQGYRHGEAFGLDGRVMHPDLMPYLRNQLGPEVARRLETYAEARATPGGRNANYPDGFPLDMKTLRDLRTAVRRESEKGYNPTEPRTTDQAMLRRLEGALTEDMHAFQQQAGAQGQRSSNMMRGVDSEYARVSDELRRPLARIFGEKVTPVDAMGKLATAAEKGDRQTLGAFMRVMAEKDNPTRAAASIVSHMMGETGGIEAFLKGYGKIPPSSRDVMFIGEEGRGLRASYDRLETLMRQMRPYQSAVTNGGGIDFTRRVNLALGAAAVAHPVNAMMLAGGGALLSRFMTSPRYVNWLTTAGRESARGWNVPAAQAHLARLAAIASNDPDHARGKAILSATADMVLPSKAKAAPLSPADRAKIEPITDKVLYAGKKSATADMAAQSQADGMNTADAWKQKGWVKAEDGKWRYEIDDSASRVSKQGNEVLSQAKNMKRPGEGLSVSLGSVLDHADLFKAYPKLANTQVEIFSEASFPSIKGMWGYLDKKTGKIIVNADKASQPSDTVGVTDFLNTLLHEVQHKVQDVEGFSYGRNLGLGAGYDKRPGEAEAYDVGRRRTMTADQRRNKVPALIENSKQLDWAGAR